MATSLSSVIKLNVNLPPGVNEFPTLKGKQRFEALLAFNWFLAGYIFIHKFIVPLILTIAQTASTGVHEFGGWYLYHVGIGFLSMYRNPRRAWLIVYLAWFGMGMQPWLLLSALWAEGHWKIGWITISGILTYGMSLIFTLFLLYRMRMPTTAFLFKLPSRIIPHWKYAVPYLLLGFITGLTLFHFGIHV